jgi:hypothetical protein
MSPINATKPLDVVREMDREVVDARFGFGVFVGRDGREHLGIERVVRGGREMDMGDERGGAGWVWTDVFFEERHGEMMIYRLEAFTTDEER